MGAKTFEDLFVDGLRDVYDAEQRIVKALPRMIDASGSPALSTALEQHLAQTEIQLTRLEQAFAELGMTAERKSCDAMKGLVAEGAGLARESDNQVLRDAALVAAAQKIEHYEIATYGTLRDWARHLGRPEIATILQETLDEERAADQGLTEIAGSLNSEAAQAR